MKKRKGSNTDSKYNFKFGRPYGQEKKPALKFPKLPKFDLHFNLSILKNKFVLGGVAAAILIVAIVAGWNIFNDRLLVIYADGTAIGYVTDRQQYDMMIDILEIAGPESSDEMLVVETDNQAAEPNPENTGSQAEANPLTAGMVELLNQPQQYAITTDLILEPVWTPPTDVKELTIASLLSSVNIEVGAAVITINNEDVVALQDEKSAQEVLDVIIQSFTTERGGREVLDYKVQEVYEIVFKPVVANSVLTLNDALNILSTGYSQRKVHVVERGDSLWSIGMANGMSVAEVKACNPELTGTLLKPGQKIAVEPLIPYVHVETHERLTTYEYVAYKTEYTEDSSLYTWQTKTIKSGVQGKNEVVYDIVCINGREQSRTKLSTTVLSEPVTRIVAKGTKIPEATGTGNFIWPVDGGGRITSYFGWTGSRYHHGVDIGVPTGTNVFAADDGVIITSTYSSSYGYYIVIDHGNGYSTLYAHNSKLIGKVGQKVTKGAIIAKSGSTGKSTGPHVHFEIRKNGDHQNPLNYFK